MYFSEVFQVDRKIINKYGAIDISLICDTPLFIDPMLIFNSKKPKYKTLHNSIVKYLYFLAEKASKTQLTSGDIKNYYTFPEVKQNWLGFSLAGNSGSALGHDFAKFFSEHIASALDTHFISSSPHVEKIMLLYDGTGKDKLSDFTTNLILGYLAKYTEQFARKYINESFCDFFYIDRSSFSYKTESFISEKFYLPFILNKKCKREYVLLTPADILREDESAINRDDLINDHIRVREAIDNAVLKAQVENYIAIAIKQYQKLQGNKKREISEKKRESLEKKAFTAALKEWPELLDYYIKLKEQDTDSVTVAAQLERERVCNQYIVTVEKFVSDYKRNCPIIIEHASSIDEARARIRFFKNRIEYGGLYKELYYNNEPVASESTLQRLFKLVWCRTNYDFNSEVNNGTGPVDFKVSCGKDNSSLIEFKLAKNKRLSHVFEQVSSYQKANQVIDSLIVVFYFSEKEFDKVNSLIKGYHLQDYIDNSVFLIDCRLDNKESASKL